MELSLKFTLVLFLFVILVDLVFHDLNVFSLAVFEKLGHHLLVFLSALNQQLRLKQLNHTLKKDIS
jgi:hypothetical protein